VLVDRDEGAYGDAGGAQEAAGMASVLTGDDVGLGQRGRGAG
jgi:hypothetical protein